MKLNAIRFTYQGTTIVIKLFSIIGIGMKLEPLERRHEKLPGSLLYRSSRAMKIFIIKLHDSIHIIG